MRLKVVSPLAVVVDEAIDGLRARDESGGFGILPGHALFLTAIEVSILSWRRAGRERACAMRGGGLTVSGGDIAIATREAIPGDDLATLDAEALSRFRSEADAERVERVETVRLQLNAIRRMVSRLRSGPEAGEFR